MTLRNTSSAAKAVGKVSGIADIMQRVKSNMLIFIDLLRMVKRVDKGDKDKKMKAKYTGDTIRLALMKIRSMKP